MSLETLLEAARYLDYKTDAKKRGEEPYDYHTFSKLYGSSNDISSSLNAQPSTKYQQSPAANSSHSSSHSSSEETRERRRSASNVSRSESVSINHEHGGRAHLKECFEMLKKQLPNLDDRKTSNLSILRGAVRYIQTLKRKERECEHEMERLAREKIAFQQRLSSLKKEVSSHVDHVETSNFVLDGDDETTTTASECGALSDFDDDIPHDASTTSNQSFTAVSDTMNSSSNSTASCLLYGGMPNAVSVSTMRQSSTLVSALPKQLSSSTLLGPPVENKGTAGLSNNVHFSAESPLSAVSGKTSLNSSDSPSSAVQNLSFSGSENSGTPTARVVSANSLHAMAGILTTPHAVQVITQPSGIKVITTPTSIPATQAAVQNISVGHHQQGHIHILAPATTSSSAPSTPTAASKSHVGESLVQASSNPAINSCKQSLVSPVTLVSPQALVSITQVGTVTKPIIINQTSSLSELITSSITSSTLALSQGLVKTTSPTVSPSLAASPLTISMKNTLQNSSATSSNGASSMVATLHVTKSHPQIIQPSSAAQNISNLLSAGGTQVNNVNRQVVTAAVKPLSTSATVRSPLSHLAGVAHMVPQSSVATPVSQLVSPVSHVSAVTPLVGSVSVVSHAAAAAVPHPQILSQSQSLGKVLASPILKSVNQIPIIQPQFLQQGVASGSTQPVVKPVVVVSVANVAPTSSVVPLSHTTAVVQVNDPQTAVQGSTQGSK